jgi:hypothetical protein
VVSLLDVPPILIYLFTLGLVILTCSIVHGCWFLMIFLWAVLSQEERANILQYRAMTGRLFLLLARLEVQAIRPSWFFFGLHIPQCQIDGGRMCENLSGGSSHLFGFFAHPPNAGVAMAD